MNEKNASLKKIIMTDYASALSVIGILVAWGGALFLFITKDPLMGLWPMAAIGVTLVAIAVIVWRICLIQSAYEDGDEVTGTITGVSFFRDRGRVTYVYTLHGERFQTSNAFMRTPLTRTLAHGMEVAVMVNRDQPKVAFIKNLYI